MPVFHEAFLSPVKYICRCSRCLALLDTYSLYVREFVSCVPDLVFFLVCACIEN
jgi:hypothetical protein